MLISCQTFFTHQGLGFRVVNTLNESLGCVTTSPFDSTHAPKISIPPSNPQNLLFWDPKTGRKVMENQRDAPMSTWTSRIGFNVMGGLLCLWEGGDVVMNPVVIGGRKS